MSTQPIGSSEVHAAVVAAAATSEPTENVLDVLNIPLKALVLSATNPRSEFDAAGLKELAASFGGVGILQPLVVRPLEGDRFEVVAGARRYKAAKLAKLEEVPCYVKALTDEEAFDVQVTENLQRADIHPLDEAEAYAKLYGRCGEIQKVAVRVSKSELYVRRRLQLNSLVRELKVAFREHRIPPAFAYQLSRFPAAGQREIAKEIGQRDMTPNQLRKLLTDRLTLKLADAPFKADDAELVPSAGSCLACPKRTGNNPALFSDIDGKDTCTDRACFKVKIDAHLVQITTQLEKETGKPVLRIAASYHPTQKGVLGEQKWAQADGAKACPHVQKGIVVEADYYGSGPKRLWKVLDVCAESKCKAHHGGYSSESDDVRKARESAQRAAVRRKVETNKAVWEAVQKGFPTAMGCYELRILGRQLYHRVFGPYRTRIARDLYHLLPDRKKALASQYEDAMQKQLDRMSNAELTRFALICLTAQDALGTPFQYAPNSKAEPDNPLYQLAHIYKVDTKGIRERIETAAKEKKAAKTAAKKARAKASGTGKAA
jgi:ParB family chromosome partitioning protein